MNPISWWKRFVASMPQLATRGCAMAAPTQASLLLQPIDEIGHHRDRRADLLRHPCHQNLLAVGHNTEKRDAQNRQSAHQSLRSAELQCPSRLPYRHRLNRGSPIHVVELFAV